MAETAPTDAPTLFLCDCGGSMAPDRAAIARGTGLGCDRIATALCRREAGRVAAALEAGGPVLVACAQETRVFAELAEERGAADRLACIDIRDRAGWGTGDPGPKMAALLAEGRLAPPAVPVIDIESEGVCLVYGPAEIALAAGAQLSQALSVTVCVSDGAPGALPEADLDVVAGRIVRMAGALGRFGLTLDGFAELAPEGRGARGFGARRDGAETECDIVLDLSGGAPLVPAHEKRDGYLRADPADPPSVARALFEAAQLVGGFEKPLHIRFTESLCAHSRAGQTGCTRCLSVCPTGAIRPAGEHVQIDPYVCAGCGACAAVCPSGAAASDEMPTAHLFRRMRVLAETFRTAGGGGPRLLVHDGHGAEMIRLAARFGRGLPGDVLPIEVPALAGFGHAEAATALALGFLTVEILLAPRTDRQTLWAETDLVRAILSGTGHETTRVRLHDLADPDALVAALEAEAPAPVDLEPILAAGGRRETVRLAAKALAGGVPEAPLPLPDGAPYGAVIVDTGACTLCMSCAGLCPTGALGDNPDRPELSFREEACIQCGLCAGLCPERAIRLLPRLDLSDAALRPRVLHEEEPFACISCGKEFGVKSTIEAITAKLASHAMFQNSDNARLIQMCDDCRVRAQYHADAQPFATGTVPRVRTTDDYADGEG
ncbi:MAG: 4Fe-4S binding protein [Paracoccaceae bacterium]